MRKLLAALLVLSGSVAFAQVNGKFQNVDAKGGYTVNGAAPNLQFLCGNGTDFVAAANCGPTLFYQTVNINGTPATQRGILTFDNNFTGSDSGTSTVVHLATNISVNAATATHATTADTATNANAVGGVALSGLCQTGGAGCPVIPFSQSIVITTGICTAGGGSFTTCLDGAPNNWPTPFTTAYSVQCFGFNPSNGTGPTGSIAGNISSISKTANGITLALQTYTSSGFTFGEVDCTGTAIP